MKILKFNPSEGFLKAIIKSPEDSIVLSYVIEPGDKLSSYSRRKIEFEKEKEIRTVKITISVEKVDLSENALSVSGKIVSSSDEDVPLHKYHTLQLEIDTEFMLEKQNFLSYQVKAVLDAAKYSPKIFICVYELGYALFYVMNNYTLKRIGELKENVPGKRFKSNVLDSFFEKLQKVLTEKKKEKWDLFIVAGSNIYNDKLKASIGKDNIIYETVSYADTGIKELMDKDIINKKLAERNILNQKKKLDEYIEGISSNDKRYVYGVEEIERRLEQSMIPEEAIVSRNFIPINKDLISKLDKLSVNIIVFNQAGESLYMLDSFGGIIVKFP